MNLNSSSLNIKNSRNTYELILKINNKNNIYVLNKVNKEIFKIEQGKNVYMETLLKNKREETILAIAMITFSEIMTKSNNEFGGKINNQNSTNVTFGKNNYRLVNNDPEMSPACERTIATIRPTETGAISNVTAATNKFIKDHPDCKRVYGVDTGCLWGGYACIATQSISCSGGGCDVPYSILDDVAIEEPSDTTEVPIDTNYNKNNISSYKIKTI